VFATENRALLDKAGDALNKTGEASLC